LPKACRTRTYRMCVKAVEILVQMRLSLSNFGTVAHGGEIDGSQALNFVQ